MLSLSLPGHSTTTKTPSPLLLPPPPIHALSPTPPPFPPPTPPHSPPPHPSLRRCPTVRLRVPNLRPHSQIQQTQNRNSGLRQLRPVPRPNPSPPRPHRLRPLSLRPLPNRLLSERLLLPRCRRSMRRTPRRHPPLLLNHLHRTSLPFPPNSKTQAQYSLCHVLSVKEFPRNLVLQNLPQHFDILCTHPMFGPESGKDGWKGLPFVYDKVRIGDEESRVSRCDRFLDVFAKEGCRMEEMSCAEHDKYAAGSQFITHTMGRILEKLQLESTPINTKGYERLLDLVDNTSSDSFDLYYGLFMYNTNAMEELERLDLAFESLKTELFGHLHHVLRKQLFGTTEGVGTSVVKPKLSKLPLNGPAFLAPN